jgi:hypothetical protein
MNVNEHELDLDQCRGILSVIASVLSERADRYLANLVDDALGGSDANLREFLTSNDLWGGAGSIADQSGAPGCGPSEARRKLESLLIQLGNLQIEAGVTNVRTAMWVDAFAKWQQSGI